MLYVDGNNEYWLVRNEVEGFYMCMASDSRGRCLGTFPVKIKKVLLNKVPE